jgi:hypothetical protein
MSRASAVRRRICTAVATAGTTTVREARRVMATPYSRMSCRMIDVITVTGFVAQLSAELCNAEMNCRGFR